MAIGIDLSIGSSAASGGGSVNTGVLQISGGIAMPATLTAVTDQSNTPSPLKLSTTSVTIGLDITTAAAILDVLPPVQTATATQFTCMRVGYSNSTIGVTNGSALQVQVATTGASRYSTTLRLSGNSDTSQAYIKGFDSDTFGVMLNRAQSNLGLFSDNGVKLGTAAFASVDGAASAMLHVKGDGTNPIARFEDNGGTPMIRIESSLLRFGGSTAYGSLQFAMTGTSISGNNNGTALGFYSQFSIAGSSDRYDFAFGGDAVANDAGVVSHLALVRNFAAAAGSASYRPLNIAYTLNNSGAQSGTATGIFLNATETLLNGMAHNLMDLGTGGASYVSKFKVTNIGVVSGVSFNTSQCSVGSNYFSASSVGFYQASSGVMGLTFDGVSTFPVQISANFIKLGGTTASFPMIKRNGTEIDFKLANDSGFCNISAKGLTLYDFNGITANSNDLPITATSIIRVNTNIFVIGSGGYGHVSAKLDVESTTKGFLPPRMTDAQVRAITTPAAGLIVFNTDISHICCYQGGAWVKFSHSPM